MTLMQPIKLTDLRDVDPLKACEFFNNCFKDPSTFTVVIVGNIDPDVARPLILQYLVSKHWFGKWSGLISILTENVLYPLHFVGRHS